MSLLDVVKSLIPGSKIVEKAADRAIDKVLGEDPATAAAREKQEDDHEIAEEQAETDRFKALWEFVLRYEGDASIQPKAILWLRSGWRPVVGVFGIVVAIGAQLADKPIPINSLAGWIILAVLASLLGTKYIRDSKL